MTQIINKISNFGTYTSGGAWLRSTFLFLFSLVAIAIGTNVALDKFGFFGTRPGQLVMPTGDERVAKHIMSQGYVPRNFDAFVIGTSVSGNLRLHTSDLKIFNFSINGANIVEIKAIADEYLAIKKPRRVFVIVHPYMTNGHEFETVKLKPFDWLPALGSTALWDAYKEDIAKKIRKLPPAILADGSYIFGESSKQLNPTLKKMFYEGDTFFVDPIALKAYKNLVNQLNEMKVPITYLVLPMDPAILSAKAKSFEAYVSDQIAMKQDKDFVIDFTKMSAELAGNSKLKFSDGIHFTDSGAEELAKLIQMKLQALSKTNQ
jgi:hypothetical protein